MIIFGVYISIYICVYMYILCMCVVDRLLMYALSWHTLSVSLVDTNRSRCLLMRSTVPVEFSAFI